ncbi:MAG TPA: hypothetical protein VM099_13210 [Gemmatimonadaceae bacterium]|nr:hypothetical protein [Gemmatimonadaceae bacterium]
MRKRLTCVAMLLLVSVACSSSTEPKDGFVYQWKGLPPGIPVVWSSDATASGKDPYLDAALARL